MTASQNLSRTKGKGNYTVKQKKINELGHKLEVVENQLAYYE